MKNISWNLIHKVINPVSKVSLYADDAIMLILRLVQYT